MNSKFLKRILALLTALAIMLSMAGCMMEDDDDDKKSSKEDVSSGSEEEGGSGSSSGGGENTDTEKGKEMEQADELSDSDLRYVMIYNPKVYDENSRSDRSTLTVGSFGGQVDVYGNRGDGLEPSEEESYTSISQLDWRQYLPEVLELEGDRADPMGTDYDEGDTQDFYYSDGMGSMATREMAEFTCVYAGDYCYIWTMDNSADDSDIEALGEEFDDVIYEEVSETFGTPRFVGDSGKVNLLVYPLYSNLLGYFAPLDLFVESEHRAMGLSGATCNTGHAIVNINSNLLGRSSTRELAYSTTAHELQHLINFSAFFSTANEAMMHTWLNEAMSGYIETELYEDAKELSGHIESYNESDLVRNGQSLYNFGTKNYDIGVYGSVYYFSKYIEELAGKEIFTDIMEYWRESYSDTLDTAEALAQSVPSKLYKQINRTIDYSPLDIDFNSDAEEWMSKLCLNFYLSTLSNDLDIGAFDDIESEDLIYDDIDGATIEGGGRIILALTDDTFEIPEDSDDGLIYVGLDEDFNPITEFIYK